VCWKWTGNFYTNSAFHIFNTILSKKIRNHNGATVSPVPLLETVLLEFLFSYNKNKNKNNHNLNHDDSLSYS
jgi:hypothetical protein